MTHLHSVYDSDSHFVINPITRTIKNVSSPKATVIQHDHNSERFTFEVPRMVEKHDMLLCNRAEVHYINIDSKTQEQSTGIYIMDDLQIDPGNADNVICSWLISRNATQYAGNLNFIVSFICDVNNEEVYRWNTAVFSGISVSAGIQNDAEEFIEPYVDIIEQWKNSIFGAGDGVLASIQNEGEAQIQAVQKAGEDITNACEIAKADVKKVLANAIVGKLSGEIITADDVSPVEHEMAVKVRGKNLFDISKIKPTTASEKISYITDVGENYIVVSCPEAVYGHTPIGITLRDVCPNCKEGETYILSAESQSQHKYIYLNGANVAWYFGKTRELTAKMLDSMIVVYGYNTQEGDLTGECTISNIQVEKGETATEYTPYVAPKNIKVRRCGKNLLDVSAMCNNYLTENADGSYTFIKGEIAGERFTKKVPFYLPAGVPFCFSADFFEHTVESKTLYMILNHADGTDSYPEIGLAEEKREITFDKPVTHIQFYLQGSEVTGAYIKFKNFQIEKGNSLTDYEPYNGAEFTPNEDGTVPGITSIAPNITILTDTAGANIDCEYIIDTKTYIDRKIAEMMEGGI